jgi:hypothetical protein
MNKTIGDGKQLGILSEAAACGMRAMPNEE